MKSKRRFSRFLLLLAVTFMFSLFYLSCASWVNAEIPKYISFQGKLTGSEGNPVSDGTYTVTFRIYAQETGGTALWSETQSVTVTDGVFNTALGAVTALNLSFDIPYWLSVQIGQDTEMTPRQRITSAGYALNADYLDNYTANQFLRSDADNTASGQITLTYPGTALIIQPSGAQATNTRLIELKDTTGSAKFSIDYEGDVTYQNATIGGILNVSGATTLANSLDVSGNTGISGDLTIGTAIQPKDITVTGDLSVSGNQVIEGVTVYEGALTIGADGGGHEVKFYADTEGKYLLWNDTSAKMTLMGDSDLEVSGIAYLDEIDLDDNEKIKLGSGRDAELYVDANDNLYLVNVSQDKDIYFQINDGGTTKTALFIDADTSRVGIATSNPMAMMDVSGDIKLSGCIRQGTMGDLAEMMGLSACIIPATNIYPDTLKHEQHLLAKPEAGEVVIIDTDGGIRRSFKPYATNVAGIVSTSPAQILRDELDNAVPVALNGVVPCKVTNENGAIRPGDLLVSSSTPGKAMRAGESPPLGSVIGKALGQLDTEKGVIEVLVMMK